MTFLVIANLTASERFRSDFVMSGNCLQKRYLQLYLPRLGSDVCVQFVRLSSVIQDIFEELICFSIQKSILWIGLNVYVSRSF